MDDTLFTHMFIQKGDLLESASDRVIKLLEHLMTISERILEQRFERNYPIEIAEMQAGFNNGK